MLLKSTLGFVTVCVLAFIPPSDDLTGVKCLMNPDANAKESASADYMGGKVYFCCGKCVKAFEGDPAKFATKANHQLALTGQFVQKGCPMSGGKVKDGVTSDVGGVTVGFCCPNCKKKVDDAKDLAAKAQLVFSTDAFKKSFVMKSEIKLDDVKCMMMPKRGVSADQSVDYKDGKVFFCCKGCVKKFNDKTADYAVMANQQLVKTGQYTQAKCPISGGATKDGKTVEVGGVKVGFCCGNCVKKANEAKDDAARAEMVFGEDAFKKAFVKK